MKRYLPLFFMAAAGLTGFAETSVRVVPEETSIHSKVVEIATADVLVTEDFSEFSEGDMENPDYSTMLARDGSMLDSELTQSEGWRGNKVYSAGGMCVLQTYDSANMAYLYTPLNDYSGDITVSFRARYLINEWEQDGTHLRDTGSSVYLSLNNNSGRTFDMDEEDDPSLLAHVRLYPNQGWCEVSVKFENRSAFNDSYIAFASPDCILIDDIKVTSSSDRFIASPEITNIRDVTETSFTIDFEPVRKAFNYYVMLYTRNGSDETGKPVYSPILSHEYMEQLEQYGMTVEEYAEATGMEITSPYLNHAIVQAHEEMSYTFTNLNPETDYYYAVISHNLASFSDPKIKILDIVPTPMVCNPTDINDNSFTANWEKVAKADNYKVNFYGITQAAEDTDAFIVFEEGFDATSNLTDNTDIHNPTIIDELESGGTIDDVTSTPGWYYADEDLGFLAGITDGKVYFPCKVTTPTFSCGGSDKIEVWINAECTISEFNLKLEFAGQKYVFEQTSNVLTESFELPTNGIKEGRISISGPSPIMGYLFIDDIIVTQNVKKGTLAYTYLGSENTAENYMRFENLNNDYNFYGYGIVAEKENMNPSEESERMLVDLVNKTGNTGVTGITISDSNESKQSIVAIYSLDGRKLESVGKGVNIIVYSNGTTKKIFTR